MENRGLGNESADVAGTSLYAHHYRELKASNISDAIIERYFYSVEGEDAQAWLIEDVFEKLGAHSQQYATKPVQWLLNQSEHLKQGGWICRANGQIKPDAPRQQSEENSNGRWVPAFNKDGSPRLVKYEPKEKPYKGAHVELMQPIGVACDTIIITEGGKKAGCAATLGYRAIPLPGVDMAAEARTKTLIAAISELPRDADIVIAFDSDSKASTIEGVARSTDRLGCLLRNAGFASIRIAKWEPSAGKGLDDICVANGANFVHSVIANAQPFAQWKSARMAEQLRANKPEFYRLTDPNRQVINQRYVNLQLPAPGSILAVSSPMETGKTVAGGKLKDEFFRRHPDGLLELQGYRNGLGQQTAGKWAMDHISDLEVAAPGGLSQTHINDTQSLAYCLDSLNRRAQAINEAIANGQKVCVFLDEADAVLKHILGGGTLGKRQAAIWELWGATLSAVISGGGYIVMAEANLSQIAVDAIAEISGAKVQAIENTYQPHAGRKVFDYSALSAKGSHADQLLAKACLTHTRQIANDGPLFLATDAQGFGEKTEAALLADGRNILRIDGDTIDQPEVRAFLENPDAYIAEYQPDVVIATTTAESGVSISGGYFENVVLYGSHLEDRALGQLSGRVRGEAPLHLFVKRRVNSFNDDPESFNVQGILKEWEQNAFDSARAADISQYFDAEILRAAGERLKGISGDRFHRLKATYQARANISRFSLHYGVLSILEAMGADISTATLQPSAFSKADKDAFENAGEVVVERRTSEFTQAEVDKSVSWAMRIESSASSTRADRTKASKVLLDASYPGLPFDDEEFVREEIIKGRGDNLRAHSFAWLCQHPKIAKIIDLQSWKAQLEQQFLILPTLRKESARVKILAQSALADIGKLESYEESTPLIVSVALWAKERAKTLGRLFRLQIKESQSNIAIVNKLLRKIGYKSKSIARPGSREDRRQIWKAEAEPYQAEVWAALEQKWAGELSDENIVIEQPSAPVSLICNKENTLMQINDTGLKSPVNSGGGPIALSESDQLALANLMIRYGSYEKLAAQLDQSAISKIPVGAINRFAAITA